MQSSIPNLKHLRQVVLQQKVFLLFPLYFYASNPGALGVRAFFLAMGPWFE